MHHPKSKFLVRRISFGRIKKTFSDQKHMPLYKNNQQVQQKISNILVFNCQQGLLEQPNQRSMIISNNVLLSKTRIDGTFAWHAQQLAVPGKLSSILFPLT